MNGQPRRYKFEPITVREPHKYDIKTFSDPDEFTAYYRQHEDEFKNVSTAAPSQGVSSNGYLSTAVLNRTYKIPGYRICVVGRGKDNEELILKKDYYSGSCRETASESNFNAELSMIKQRLDNIEQFLQRLS